MGILLVATVGFTTYFLSFNRVKTFYTDLAFNSALMAAEIVGGDELNVFLTYGANDRYFETFEALQTLKKLYDITYLYVIKPGNEYRSAIFIFDIYTDATEPEHIIQLGEIVTESDVFDYYLMLHVFLTGAMADGAIVTYSRFGHLASAYVPVLASDGSIVAVAVVDISMDMIIADVWYQTIQISVAVLIITALFLTIMLVLMQWQILNPIAKLSRHMKDFSAESDELRTIELLRTGGTHDELQDISTSFNHMVKALGHYMINLRNETAERERIMTELDVASKIQESMLPCNNIFQDIIALDIEATVIPAKQVGGDFYDFFMIGEDKLAIVIADVSDKSIPAALFMVISKTLIKSYAQQDKSPKEVFEAVNSLLCENNETGMFVTAFLGILEISTGKFEYVNAGHNPPLFRTGSEGSGIKVFDWLNTQPDFLLAGSDDTFYEQYSVTLKQGDEFFLYTDGVTEATNKAKEFFGELRLIESLNSCLDSSIADVIAIIEGEIEKFVDGANQYDDIAMLMFRYKELQP